MSKNTNKGQMEILLSCMQKNRGIACGFHKKGKEEVVQFWKNTAEQLNATGPPMKEINEWKKVWIDQKKYVRNKLAQNLKMRNGTGGGPNKQYLLSPFEEAVANLINTKGAVEGVPGHKFGIKRKHVNKENEVPHEENTQVHSLFENIESDIAVLFDDICENSEAGTYPTIVCNMIPESTADPDTNICSNVCPSTPSAKKNKTKSVSDVLDKELQVQEQMLEKISEAVADQKEQRAESNAGIKKIYRSLDRFYDVQKKILAETIRHNAEMEKIRKSEIEKNVAHNCQLIEIEKLKIELMKKK